MHRLMSSLRLAPNLLLVTVFALIQNLASTSAAVVDRKKSTGSCWKEGKILPAKVGDYFYEYRKRLRKTEATLERRAAFFEEARESRSQNFILQKFGLKRTNRDFRYYINLV